jgi:hypothetical protein
MCDEMYKNPFLIIAAPIGFGRHSRCRTGPLPRHDHVSDNKATITKSPGNLSHKWDMLGAEIEARR